VHSWSDKLPHCPECKKYIELEEKKEDLSKGQIKLNLNYLSCPVCGWNNKEKEMKKVRYN